MGERTSYPPGTLSWAELATSDADAAKAFYTRLFGWEYEDNPAGEEGQIYSMALGDGDHVAALFKDGPANWMPYFGHDDVDRLVGEIEGLGGKLYMGPAQLPNGRIAVLADPQGAVFAVWTGEYDD
jgi:uncharacterized protein